MSYLAVEWKPSDSNIVYKRLYQKLGPDFRSCPSEHTTKRISWPIPPYVVAEAPQDWLHAINPDHLVYKKEGELISYKTEMTIKLRTKKE